MISVDAVDVVGHAMYVLVFLGGYALPSIALEAG